MLCGSCCASHTEGGILHTVGAGDVPGFRVNGWVAIGHAGLDEAVQAPRWQPFFRGDWSPIILLRDGLLCRGGPSPSYGPEEICARAERHWECQSVIGRGLSATPHPALTSRENPGP